MVSWLGHFPFEVIECSPRKDELFHADGTYRGQIQICREKRLDPVSNADYFISHDLTQNILGYSERRGETEEEIQEEERRRLLFADFLLAILKLNPADRLTPEAALRHPFITADFAN
jgi:hypothetical protein